MAEWLVNGNAETDYVDRKVMRACESEAVYIAARDAQLERSATVYVGNLSFYTTEAQIWSHFSRTGPVAEVVMGLCGMNRQPGGFCFVRYLRQESAFAAVNDLHKSRLDDRIIRVSWDIGEVDSSALRRWGRGFGGVPVREYYRQDFDLARGGFGLRRAVDIGADRLVTENEIEIYDWIPPPREFTRDKRSRQ